MTYIDGLLLATGGLTTLAIRCLVNMGVKLQSDVQIIGFGRIDIATGVSIPYVKQPIEEICKNSLDILLNRIESQEDRIVDCIVPASIVAD